jgi:hypothetical protein
MRFRLLMIFALLTGAARASNVSNEVSLNTTQATEANPRSGSLGDSLSASLDATEHLAVNLGIMATTQDSAPSPFPNESPDAAVLLFSTGLDWEVNDNWTLGLTAELSPESRTFADAPIGIGTAHIRSKASERAAGIDLSYDSAGESALEWSVTGGVTYTDFSVDQTIPLVTDLSGRTLTAAQVRTLINDYCTTGKGVTVKNCGKRVLREIAATPFNLASVEFSAGVTAVVMTNTDLTVSADVYNYFQDATQAAYASLIFNGRGGAGVPVAPLQFMIRPDVVRRFGDFSAKFWVQAGQYVKGVGQSTAGVGLKLQYKFTKEFRLWATVLASRDVDDQNRETNSGSFSLGAGYRF